MEGWVAGLLQNKANSDSNQAEVEVKISTELGNKLDQRPYKRVLSRKKLG